MEPYVIPVMAIIGDKDTGPTIEELNALPLEKRYVWRVASALKWAFADFDKPNRRSRPLIDVPAGSKAVAGLTEHRPLQFCLFLSALFGQKQMEILMVPALKNSRTIETNTAPPGACL